MVTTDKYRGIASLLAVEKNPRTPRFAFSPLRISLMTSVSTRYTSTSAIVLLASEVAVLAHVRDCRKNIRHVPPLRSMEGRLEDLPVFLFSTAITLRRPLFESFDEIW